MLKNIETKSTFPMRFNTIIIMYNSLHIKSPQFYITLYMKTFKKNIFKFLMLKQHKSTVINVICLGDQQDLSPLAPENENGCCCVPGSTDMGVAKLLGL